MSNSSATGGPLLPEATPSPLEGQALFRFFQQWIVGISGMNGTLVRPRYQTEPPNIPAEGEAWVAFGINDHKSDVFPWVGHVNLESSGPADELQRQQEIELLLSFYDLGVTGVADELAGLVRDACVISQNREPLEAKNFTVGFVGDAQPVPMLVKTRWLYRVDLTITLRRVVIRHYDVRDIASAEIELEAENPGSRLVVDETINVTP